MAGILDDPSVARTLSDRGRIRASSFHWDKTASQTLAVYDQL